MKRSTGKPEPERKWIPIVLCERCDGILYASDSMARGMGPGCYHKARQASAYARLEAQGQMRMFPEPAEVAGGEQGLVGVPGAQDGQGAEREERGEPKAER